MNHRGAESGAGSYAERGVAPCGQQYRIEVPAGWNGTLLLYSNGLPLQPGDPPWDDGNPLFSWLLEEGYAVAGTGGGPMFWTLEPAFVNAEALLDRFTRQVRAPDRTVAWGFSIGGTITAGLVQLMPERLSAALPICGNLAGAVATHDRELDVAFAVKVLLGDGAPLDVVGILDPDGNLEAARSVIGRARTQPEGRARLALAAAMGGVPGWHDPLAPAPRRDELDARLENQLRWFDEIGFLVYFNLRAHVELRAGGNPSENGNVDYRVLLEGSAERDEVEGLYEATGTDLGRDLATLASAPRISADPAARRYLERNIVFTGDLGGVPMLTLHTEGDGLVPPDHEQAYADVVVAAGHEAQLRQLFVHRGGHCTITAAEVLVALEALLSRVEAGAWPPLDPSILDDAVSGRGEHRTTIGGRPVPAAFSPFTPPRFPRRYDGRDL